MNVNSCDRPTYSLAHAQCLRTAPKGLVKRWESSRAHHRVEEALVVLDCYNRINNFMLNIIRIISQLMLNPFDSSQMHNCIITEDIVLEKYFNCLSDHTYGS